jgi:hypothetical protein
LVSRVLAAEIGWLFASKEVQMLRLRYIANVKTVLFC